MVSSSGDAITTIILLSFFLGFPFFHTPTPPSIILGSFKRKLFLSTIITIIIQMIFPTTGMLKKSDFFFGCVFIITLVT